MNINALYLHGAYGNVELVDEVTRKAGISCQILAVSNEAEYLLTLKSNPVDIILCDEDSQDMSATDALTALKFMGFKTPFIVLSAAAPGNMAKIVALIKQGASDYIQKAEINTLPGAILSALNVVDSEINIHSDLKDNRPPHDQPILSEQRYQQIVETAQEGIWIIDENLVTTFVNNKLCEILGYSAAEIIGKHNYDFKTEAEKTKTLERLTKRNLHAIESHESSFITKNGSEVFCIVVTNGLFDGKGNYLGLLAMLTEITQRKADEEALRKSEANLSAIIENTTDLVYSLDTSLRFITFNQVFKNTMKHVYGFDIVQGKCIMDLLEDSGGELAVTWTAIYKQALSGETLHFVKEYPYADDKVFLSYSINPICEAGKVIGLSCFSRDIAKQKKDEAAIRQSAANLTAIIDNTEEVIYSVDKNLRYITFNKAHYQRLLRVFNIAINPGDDALDVLRKSDPDSVPEWENIYTRALNGERLHFTREFNIDRLKFFYSFFINPIWENDAVTGVSCAARDITKQITDEMAVRKSEASLRTIFNNTNLAYMLIDTGGKIVSFNTVASKYLENRVSLIPKEGDPILKFVDPDRQDFILDALQKTKNGTAINYEINKAIKGIPKWFDMTWAGIKDDENQDFGHIFTIEDITEKKKAEIEWEKITADLLQRNKALEQFTYIISHNLRAPVANIIGLASLTTDMKIENEEINEIIQGMSQSAAKLDEVISDLNQILQINQDINENIELISLNQLIENIQFSIRNLIEKERVTIICNFDEAAQILSIKSFIYSILYNLILNSIKYRKTSVSPVINITTRINQSSICIDYKDNGRGIDTSKYGRELFGLYKRFDTSVEGKGMGLFMVKMQVESLGGKISLRSELEKGTEFALEFPQSHLQKK